MLPGRRTGDDSIDCGPAAVLAPFVHFVRNRSPEFTAAAAATPGPAPIDRMETSMKQDKRARTVGTVRTDDIDPYTALRWVGTMFKAAAVFLAIAVIGEFIAGLQTAGTAAVPTLLGELARTVVLAIVMWGGGDLVRLLVQLGNDVRAERILLARLVHRTPLPAGSDDEGVEPAAEPEGRAGADLREAEPSPRKRWSKQRDRDAGAADSAGRRTA